MAPNDTFWGGVGEAVGSSPGWMVVIALLIIGALYITSKYIVPSHERTRMRKLDIEQQRVQNDSDRIKANAMLAEQQRQTNLLVDGMRQSLNASTAHTDVLVAELRGARDRSRDMGHKVDHLDDTATRIDDTTARIDVATSHTESMMEDIHRIFVSTKAEVTD